MGNKITRDLLIILATAVLTSVYTLIAFGGIVAPIENDVVRRLNDFMNYAVQELNGGEHLHPMYKGLIQSNITLAPRAAKLMLDYGFSRIFIESTITGLFLIIQNMGAAVFSYSLVRDKKICLLVLVALLFINGNNEPIYGFVTNGFITGNIAASLFLLELGLVGLKRYSTLGFVLITHITLHPTSAILWLPVPLVLAQINSNNIVSEFKWNTFLRKIDINYLFLLYPILVGCFLCLHEYLMQPFPKNSTSNFWEMASVAFYHTKFSDNGKFTYLFVYLCELAALLLLSKNKYFDQFHKQLICSVAFLGMGILVASLILVETNISQLFAMTLPLRFSVVMYMVIAISFVKIAANRNDSGGFIGIIFLATLFFNNFIPGFYSYFKPMMVCQIAVLFYLYSTVQLSLRKVLIYSILIFSVMIVLYYLLPIERLGNVKSNEVLYLYKSLKMADFGMHPRAFSSVLLYILNASFFVTLLGIFYLLRRFLDLSKWAVWILFFSLFASVVIAQNRNMGISNFLKNLYSIGSVEQNSTVLLVEWFRGNVAPDKLILSEPALQVRRVLPNHISVDLDLISLLPYAPRYTSFLYHELKKTYCIDVHQLFLKEQFLNSQTFDNQTWGCAKNRAIENGTYDYVIEYAQRNRSNLPIVFENERYRVYKIKEK
jgi:hypothetical protein